MGKFYERFKQLREEKGYSQQMLADKLRISRSTVGMYESGLREPNFELLEEIADFFNVDMDYLVGKSTIKRKIPVLQKDGIQKESPALTAEEKEFLNLFETASQEAREFVISTLKRSIQVSSPRE